MRSRSAQPCRGEQRSEPAKGPEGDQVALVVAEAKRRGGEVRGLAGRAATRGIAEAEALRPAVEAGMEVVTRKAVMGQRVEGAPEVDQRDVAEPALPVEDRVGLAHLTGGPPPGPGR